MNYFVSQIYDAVIYPFQDRKLLRMFISRDVQSRYKNSWGGLFWLLVQPIIMLSIYTLVFQHILGVKWGMKASSGIEFALNLYLGLMIFNIFAESLQAAPTVLRGHSHLIKKVLFPIRVLPTVPVGLALSDAAFGLTVWVVIYVIMVGPPPLTALYLPLVILPLMLSLIGLTWVIASLSVYMRDIAQIVRFVVTALLFLSPIFFPLQSMPTDLQTILAFNPLAIEIEMIRGVMILGVQPEWGSYFSFLGFSLLIYIGGYIWFDLTREGFVDVL
jgi:lipopolysaccharide transport system permease protein